MDNNMYHGDAGRAHSFWVYPKSEKLAHTRWDTHFVAQQFCNNSEYLGKEGDLYHWKCKGH